MAPVEPNVILHSSYREIIVIDIHYGSEHSITDVIKRSQLILLGLFYIAHAPVHFPSHTG